MGVGVEGRGFRAQGLGFRLRLEDLGSRGSGRLKGHLRKEVREAPGLQNPKPICAPACHDFIPSEATRALAHVGLKVSGVWGHPQQV